MWKNGWGGWIRNISANMTRLHRYAHRSFYVGKDIHLNGHHLFFPALTVHNLKFPCLNAMTYPDKTLYPVASCNDADFKNLMDVYMDAVFYPNNPSEWTSSILSCFNCS